MQTYTFVFHNFDDPAWWFYNCEAADVDEASAKLIKAYPLARITKVWGTEDLNATWNINETI